MVGRPLGDRDGTTRIPAIKTQEMVVKEYSNGEVTILWKPELCIHSGVCVRTLPEVYNPQERPWIKPENASTEAIVSQVARCPSGALSIKPGTEAVIKTDREDDGKRGRFVSYVDGTFAGEMTYVWAGSKKFIIDHTGVESQFGGRGIGKGMVLQAVAFAREQGVRILPLCPFAKMIFDREGFPDVRA